MTGLVHRCRSFLLLGMYLDFSELCSLVILLAVGLDAGLSLYECSGLDYIGLEQCRRLDTACKLSIIEMLEVFEVEGPTLCEPTTAWEGLLSYR
ncbi:hypothetical protein BJX96DRAFT_144761 [Aspergillus floccosus]